MGGSKGGSGGSGSYDYRGTIAALVCAGPVDEVLAVNVDEKTVWEGEGKGTPAAPPAGLGLINGSYSVISIPGYGDLHFYWGSDTQVASDVLNNNEFGEIHPAYRGWCYLVLVDFLFGRERPQAPNIEVIVRRAARLADGTPDPTNDGQANPLAVIEEALSNARFGFDLPASAIDGASFDAALATVAADPARNFASPLLTSQVTARQLAETAGDLAEFRIIASGRQFGAVAWRREGQGVNPATLPVVTSALLAEPPRLALALPSQLPNQWSLTFTDRSRRYGENALRAVASDARENPGGLRDESLSRDWIARSEQAAAWLDSFITRRGHPAWRASIALRAGHSAVLAPGSLVRLDVDLEPGGDLLLAVMRVAGIDRPDGNRPAAVRLEQEPAFAPVAVTVTETPGTLPTALPQAFRFTRMVECPPNFDDFKVRRVCVLGAREDLTTLGAGLYARQPGKEAVVLGWVRQLSLMGRLAAPIDAAAETIAVTLTRPWAEAEKDEAVLLATSPGLQAAINNDLILILLETTADGTRIATDATTGGSLIEFCSVELTADGGHAGGYSTWTLTVYRGRLGWPARAFTSLSLTEAWIIARVDLAPLQHRLLTVPAVPPAVRSGELPPAGLDAKEVQDIEWRAVPFNAYAAYPSDVTPPEPEPGPDWRPFLFGAQSYAPQISWMAGTPDGAILGGNPPIVTWQIRVTDADGNLARVQVLGIIEGQLPIILSDVDLAAVASYMTELPQTWTLPAGIGTAGARLEVRASDTTQNVAVASRNYHVQPLTPTVTQPPLIKPAEQFFANSVTVTVSPVQSGSSIVVRIVRDDGFVALDWSEQPPNQPLTYPTSRSHTVYAYAKAPGFTDSAIIFRTYSQGTGGGRIEPQG